jgi:hypothetical protein
MSLCMKLKTAAPSWAFNKFMKSERELILVEKQIAEIYDHNFVQVFFEETRCKLKALEESEKNLLAEK